MAETSPTLSLLAPLSGVVVPLETVPDPVFAQKMVGDGMSIDPTSCELISPLAGTVTMLHASGHALTIRGTDGTEVLIHIGLDTVTLRGAGFTPKVSEGQAVAAGELLIRFDPEMVGRSARSLLTQMVIANRDEIRCPAQPGSCVTAGRDVVLEVGGVIGRAGTPSLSGPTETAGPVRLPNPSGLHARPSAVLAAAAKKFRSDIRIARGNAEANAKSIVAIMGLATQKGDQILVRATGPDARAAAPAIAELLAAGCGEAEGAAPAPAQPVATAAVAPRHSEAGLLGGVAASPGVAVGQVFQLRPEVIDVVEAGTGAERERSRLDQALQGAREALEALAAARRGTDQAKILEAHRDLLEDPELFDLAIAAISTGKSAAFAWRDAFTRHAARLEALDNAVLRERAADLRDVGRRVLLLLAGAEASRPEVPPNSILITEELSPSDTAQLDRTRVLGFCTTTGGATSHVAILARSLGIPAVCGIDQDALTLTNGAVVLLDGDQGTLRLSPTDAQVADARERQAKQAARQKEEESRAQELAHTKDGVRIEVVVNVRHAADAREGVAKGAEGVGVLRSEFLFDERTTAPTEQEQADAYIAVAKELGPKRSLVVRTLDVGGDKPLSYVPMAHEENPFLGIRGVRLSLDRPELFRTQLRGILRAAPYTKLHIMFPMIALLEELREAKAILAEEARNLGVEGVKVGIMIEVPSAALLAEPLAKEVDFFSLGTNDLTQYTLAMDRGHPQLAKKADALHPAILQLIARTCEGAHKSGKWVGVCGGLASDTLAVPALVGMGVRELSVVTPAVAAVKATVARFTLPECEALAQEVLAMATASEVRARLTQFAQ